MAGPGAKAGPLPELTGTLALISATDTLYRALHRQQNCFKILINRISGVPLMTIPARSERSLSPVKLETLTALPWVFSRC